jgi:ABC-type bacteriocin/lantibiotic exporter with double-glycine peptidase domain
MLILDEAINSLDSENKGRVLDAIESRRVERSPSLCHSER